MRIVDEEGTEVQNPDMSLGYTKPHKLLVAHHDEVPYEPAVYENVLVHEYENGGKVYNRILKTPAVDYVPAWDEYEDVLLYVLYTPEELEEIEKQKEEAEKAQQQEAEEQAKKEEAKRQAETRMNLAVRSAVSMIMPMMSLDSVSTSTVAKLSPFYDEWSSAGVTYAAGTPFYYIDALEKTRYFRASQKVVSSTVYKPGDVGTESLYYEFFIAPDGYEIYQECKGAYNAYRKGDEVHYPDEDSPIYRSLVDGNDRSPAVAPSNWEKVE